MQQKVPISSLISSQNASVSSKNLVVTDKPFVAKGGLAKPTHRN